MKTNKIIALALAMVMSLSMLAGCSSSDDTAVDTTTPDSTAVESTETTEEVAKVFYVDESSTASSSVLSTTATGTTSDQIAFTYDGGEISADIFAYGLSQGFFEAETNYNENLETGELAIELIPALYFDEAKEYAIEYLLQIIAIDQILKENDFEMTVALVEAIDSDVAYAEETMGTEAFESTLSVMGISREGFRNEQLRVYAFEEGLDTIYGKTEEELYESYQNDYYKAQHILIPFTTDSTGAVSDEDYATAKALAEEVLAEVNSGEKTFEELIELYSQDSAMPASGYAFKEGYMLEDFEAAAVLLEIGEVSGLVEASYGIHIIKAVEGSLENYEENATNIATIEYYANADLATNDLFTRMEELEISFVETDLGASITADNYSDYFIVD